MPAPNPQPYLNALAMLEKPDGVIAIPTDTVYGLACKIDHPEAIERIYTIKQRNPNQPLILLGCERQALVPFVDALPSPAIDLMESYWPGPLTIILPKSELVSDAVTRGMGTVGIRVPQCPSLRALLEMVPEGVLATTSANISGEPACLTAASVALKLGDELDYILPDDAAVTEEIPSTIVAVEADGTLQVLRTGSIMLD